MARTNTYENITLPQTSFAGGNKFFNNKISKYLASLGGNILGAFSV